MANVLFIYGTTGGNTQMAVESAAHILEGKGHKVALQRAEISDPKDLLKYDACVLASPTYGHGHLQEYMAAFVAKMKKVDLKGKPCGVISLGDPKYNPEFHLESAVLLEKAIQGSGGKLLPPSLRISRSPIIYLDTLLKTWAENLSITLNS